MKALRGSVWLAAALVLCVRPAVAGILDVSMRLACAAEATAGEMIPTALQFENGECAPVNVRVISSIVGNANQSLGGMGIAGPVVVDSMIPVPAATNQCGPPACCTDQPGTNLVVVSTPPPIPASLAGTVATLVVLTEWDLAGSSKTTKVAQCLVNILPAP